jgi:hypothetical protein
MENLAPPLKLCLYLRFGLERGDSIRTCVKNYLKEINDDFSITVSHFSVCIDQDFSTQAILNKEKSPYRRALMHLIFQAYQGKPVLQLLQQLETEVQRACDIEIERNLQLLPLKILMPLLFLQFPAFLLLLLGPLLRHIVSGF